MARIRREETLADRKRHVQMRIRKAESSCMLWSLIKQNNADDIRKINRDIEELEAKRARLTSQLLIAPEEHEKAKERLAKCKRELGQETATPKVDRVLKLAAQLQNITADLEGVELTAEQIELLQKVKAMSL